MVWQRRAVPALPREPEPSILPEYDVRKEFYIFMLA